MSDQTKTPQLSVITAISRLGASGLVNKNSITLLDGKPINGLANFSLDMSGDEPTGFPTANISLKGYVQVVQEMEKTPNEPAGSNQE